MPAQVLDYSLTNFKVPGLAQYTPPFGTKKADGSGLTTTEITRNEMMPFMKQRSISGIPAIAGNDPPMGVIGVDSIAAPIEFDANFAVLAGVQLQLDDPSYEGQLVRVVASFATGNPAIITLGVSGTPKTVALSGGEAILLFAINGKWIRSTDVDLSDLQIASALGIDFGSLAVREILKTNNQRIQQGTATILNRGVISGCTVSKSSTAVRNISLALGTFFMNGLEMVCPVFQNAALVPANYSDAQQLCYAYLFIDSTKNIQFACTPLGGSVPEEGLTLYRFTVPAGNNETNDPYLASVVMTDVRRIEAGYPVQFNSLAYSSVSLPCSMLDSDYEVVVEVLNYKGGWNQRQAVYPGDKAANGFKLFAEGSLDAVKVRWTALKLNL
jgi:hypothetical protein